MKFAFIKYQLIFSDGKNFHDILSTKFSLVTISDSNKAFITITSFSENILSSLNEHLTYGAPRAPVRLWREHQISHANLSREATA